MLQPDDIDNALIGGIVEPSMMRYSPVERSNPIKLCRFLDEDV